MPDFCSELIDEFKLLILSEKEVKQLVSLENAISAVEATFAAYDREEACPYPVIRENVGDTDAVFGIKSGLDTKGLTLGLKAGGYWPKNITKGLTNHQSTIFLFEIETGQLRAVIKGNHLTGIRTGAASALATKFLAREDATILGVIGTGFQSGFQLRATSIVRHLKRVIAWDPVPKNLDNFRQEVSSLNLEFEALDRELLVHKADILITVTPSKSSLVRKDWIRPGTHINAMGADTIGKQELDPTLVASASVYTDSIEQAITIGECQHAYKQGLLNKEKIKGTLGGLITGRVPGRFNSEEITLFDGTGIALQDLAVAALAYKLAEEKSVGSWINF